MLGAESTPDDVSEEEELPASSISDDDGKQHEGNSAETPGELTSEFASSGCSVLSASTADDASMNLVAWCASDVAASDAAESGVAESGCVENDPTMMDCYQSQPLLQQEPLDPGVVPFAVGFLLICSLCGAGQ